MNIGALGLALIKKSEVFISHAYDDQDKQWPRRRITWNGGRWVYPDGTPIKGTPTYGYGFVAHSPSDCQGDITEEHASEMLVARVADYVAAFARAWAQYFVGKPDPTQNQIDSGSSFAWNEGQTAVRKLIEHLSTVDITDAAAVTALFLAWDKWSVNGQLVENDGLRLRRLAEATLFLRPVEIAWGPADVERILGEVFETSAASVDDFAGGSPLPDDDSPPTEKNS